MAESVGDAEFVDFSSSADRRAARAEPAPLAVPDIDPDKVSALVGTIVCSSGEPEAGQLELANAWLAHIGRTPLSAADFVILSPERLAPVIPDELRAPLLALFSQLTVEGTTRARLVRTCAGLWQLPLQPFAPAVHPSRLVRWLVGDLPNHSGRSKEDPMLLPYRQTDPAAPVAKAPPLPLRVEVERIRGEAERVIAAVERVIIGKRAVIERVLWAMAAQGHVLLVDAPGTGKTQLCKALAAAIAVRFGRIQFTPDLLPLDITGANVLDMRQREFVFRPGPIFCQLLLADEINRATPKTQSALLEVMEERAVTVDGVTHRLDEPFQVLATMNPLDHQGTYALPAAQVDRFMMMLEMGYPSPEDEVRVLDRHLGAQPALSQVDAALDRLALIAWQKTVPQIHVSPEVKRASVDYVQELRRDVDVGRAPSPRATLAWVKVAQARAMFQGREFVTVEDLLEVAPDVLRHRLDLERDAVSHRLGSVRR